MCKWKKKKMEQITNNFTMEEFTRSETAEKLGIKNVPGSRERRCSFFQSSAFNLKNYYEE